MMTIHRWDKERKLTVVKGSPLEVLERCRFRLQGGQVLELEEEDRERLELENARMAGAGLRVLGLAFYWGRVKKHELDHPEGCSLIWAGLVGLADPLRPGAKEMIAELHQAGVRTAVITGDQSLTAYHIGEELGLSGDDPLITMDAINLKGMSRASLTGVATRAHIFARLSPTQKLEIIQAYQNAGLRVAMVGDGFNDVLALKVADVGIAMGREGADLARHTADLVLEDDDIRKVTAAIAEGRSFYENLRKSIRFLIVNNKLDVASELLSRSGLMEREAAAWQPLWTNLACLSLAMDPPNPEIMEREYTVPEKRLLSGQGWGDTTPDGLALMGGAGGAGSLRSLALWYGSGDRAFVPAKFGDQPVAICRYLPGSGGSGDLKKTTQSDAAHHARIGNGQFPDPVSCLRSGRRLGGVLFQVGGPAGRRAGRFAFQGLLGPSLFQNPGWG